jgi:TM2 domain-containing membrane protein YozV
MKCFKHPKKDAVGECINCGKGVCSTCAVEVEDKIYCKDCLKKGKSAEKEYQKIKSSGLAVILSFFIPGLGQIYTGKIGMGILLLILGIIFGILCFILIGIIPYIIIWAYSMIDAYNTAEDINRGKIK